MRLADFGAFVNILPGKDGLVHLPDHRCLRAERGRLPENRRRGEGEGTGRDRQGRGVSPSRKRTHRPKRLLLLLPLPSKSRLPNKAAVCERADPWVGFLCRRPVWRRLSPCSFGAPDIRGTTPLRLAKEFCNVVGLPQAAVSPGLDRHPGTSWCVPPFFMVWPFLHPATVTTTFGDPDRLILGPRRRFPIHACQLLWRLVLGQMGRRNILLFGCLVSATKRGPAGPSPTRWAGWHSG